MCFDILPDLLYNLIMKRILLILALLIGTAVFAEESTVSQQAAILYAGNDIKGAFDMLISIREDDRTPQNYLLLGNILQDMGKENDAIFMYNRALLKDEKYYKANYNLGTIYLAEEKPNLAIEQFKKVIKLKPDNAYAHYNLGCAYLKAGEIKKARDSFLRAVDLKNTVPDFHYNLAYTYKKLKNEKAANRYLEYYNQLMLNQL